MNGRRPAYIDEYGAVRMCNCPGCLIKRRLGELLRDDGVPTGHLQWSWTEEEELDESRDPVLSELSSRSSTGSSACSTRPASGDFSAAFPSAVFPAWPEPAGQRSWAEEGPVKT